MPRDITAALKTHIASGSTTLATCWRIQRADGVVFTYTTHDVPITYGGEIYSPINAGEPSAVRMTLKLSADNSDVDIMISSSITAAALKGGVFDYAACKNFLINYADVSMGPIKLQAGKLGRVEVKDQRARVEFNSFKDLLNVPFGRTLLPNCDAELGDTRCNISLAGYTQTGTVTAFTDKQYFVAGALTGHGNDFFKYGKLTWTNGQNNGLAEDVKGYTSATGALVLHQPAIYAVAVGNTFIVIAGCDKSFATCINKFNNRAYFRGFPHVPTRGDILKQEPL